MGKRKILPSTIFCLKLFSDKQPSLPVRLPKKKFDSWMTPDDILLFEVINQKERACLFYCYSIFSVHLQTWTKISQKNVILV